MKTSLGLCGVAFAALGIVACAESDPVADGPTLPIETEHQLKVVDDQALVAVLKTYRGKGLLVNIWSTT